jgi:hypothetical protein
LGELRSLASAVVRDSMVSVKRALNSSIDEQDHFMSRRQVADRWGVSTETVKRRCRDGILPVVRFNRRLIRHRLSDVLKVERDALGGVK